MTLSDWARKANISVCEEFETGEICSGISDDSRTVQSGNIFVWMPFGSGDRAAYLRQAVEKGCGGVLVATREDYQAVKALKKSAIQVEGDFNTGAGELARLVLGEPDRDMRIIGITGTNGKTTVAWLLRQAYLALGQKAGYLGTLGIQGLGELREASNTTPFPVSLWQEIARLRSEDVEVLAMEVSSHALHQRRVAGMRFSIAALTQITQDHLDYHETVEAYADAKRLLFTDYLDGIAVLNAEDAVGQQWMRDFTVHDGNAMMNSLLPYPSIASAGTVSTFDPPVLSFGLEFGDLNAKVNRLSATSIDLEFVIGEETAECHLSFGGGFHVENAMVAAAVLLADRYSLVDVAWSLGQCSAVPGRFEAVGDRVIVDYAHTPDAVEKLLTSAREITAGRLITVVGCGGDRDRVKRPLMAQVAVSRSDQVIFTEDNPRTEDPAQIFSDMTHGLTDGNWRVIPNRREAIFAAVRESSPGDLVVIAGKGHEDYQIIGREKIHFDDREVAREALA